MKALSDAMRRALVTISQDTTAPGVKGNTLDAMERRGLVSPVGGDTLRWQLTAAGRQLAEVNGIGDTDDITLPADTTVSQDADVPAFDPETELAFSETDRDTWNVLPTGYSWQERETQGEFHLIAPDGRDLSLSETAPVELAHPMDSDPFAGLPDNGVDVNPITDAPSAPDAGQTAFADVTIENLWTRLTDWARTYDRLHALSSYSDVLRDTDVDADIEFTDGRWLRWSDMLNVDSWDAVKGADGNPVLLVTLASYGEYSSTTVVDAANYRFLSEHATGDMSWRCGTADRDPLLYEVGRSAHDGVGWVVRVGDDNWTVDELTELLSLVDGSTDGEPYGGQDSVDAYEHELEIEWWEGCGRYDIQTALCDLVGVEVLGEMTQLATTAARTKTDTPLIDIVHETVRAVVNDGGYDVEWVNEGACSRYPYSSRSSAAGQDWVAEVGQRLFVVDRYASCPVCDQTRAVLPNGQMTRHTALFYGPPLNRSAKVYAAPVPRHCHGSGQNVALTTV